MYVQPRSSVGLRLSTLSEGHGAKLPTLAEAFANEDPSQTAKVHPGISRSIAVATQ